MNTMRTLSGPAKGDTDDLLGGTAYGQMDGLFDATPREPVIDRRFVERREGVARAAFRARSRKQLVAGALVVVALMTAVVARSGLLSVRAVNVTGMQRLDADAVRRSTQLLGQPSMLNLDAEEIAARVERLPWVASASVIRHWPNQVEIRVVEHTPAAVAIVGNEVALVAGNDRVLERSVQIPTGVPQIVGVTKLPGDGSQLQPAGIARVAAELPPILRRSLVSIDVADAGGVIVKLLETDIRLGRLTDVALKLKTAAAVIERGDTCRVYVDVSVPAAPVAGC